MIAFRCQRPTDGATFDCVQKRGANTYPPRLRVSNRVHEPVELISHLLGCDTGRGAFEVLYHIARLELDRPATVVAANQYSTKCGREASTDHLRDATSARRL